MSVVSMKLDIDIDVLIETLTDSQKVDLFHKMQDELKMVPRTVEGLFKKGGSPRDSELGKALYDLWLSKDYLNEDQRSRIIQITKESYL